MSAPAKPVAIVVFKTVPGGHVCQVPNEWLIGRASTYLVTDAQKDEIVGRSARPSFVAIFCWMMSLVALGFGAAMGLNWVRHSYQFNEPTPGDMAIIMAATLVATLLSAKMAFQPVMNRLRPLLATLPKSDIRFTRDDMRNALEKATSPKQLRRQAGLYSFIAVSSLVQLYFQFKAGRSVLSGDPLSILLAAVACMVGAVVILLLLQAQQKAKQERGVTVG